MEQEQQQSTTSTILGNLPTILGLIGMFLIAALYFVSVPAGTSPVYDFATSLRNATTLALPWPIAIVSILLLRRHTRLLINRDASWPYSLTLVASAVIMVLLYLANGANMNQATLLALYNNISVIGMLAVTSAIGISIISPMIRIYRAKTWTMAFLIGISILGFMTFTPMGEMINPAIPQVGNWIQTYIGGASDSAFWVSTYIGAVALIVRMILLKEKLRPA
jgi:hypothetical protein